MLKSLNGSSRDPFPEAIVEQPPMKTLISGRRIAVLSLTFILVSSAFGTAAPPDPPADRFPASRAGSRCLTARTWKAGSSAIRLPGRSGLCVTMSGSTRPTPADCCPWDRAAGPNAALLCGDDGRGSDIMTAEDFYDYELHLEFTVPKGSNSGVYNRGLFEIQVFDSFGAAKLAFHDCGALYERAIPAENLSRPPGEWQTYDITMKGKTISLVWNGKPVFRDMDVRYGETDRAAFERLNQENAGKPEALRVQLRHENGKYVGFFGEGGTRSSLDGPDRPGPILLQGDHGPVAYRNLYIRRLEK